MRAGAAVRKHRADRRPLFDFMAGIFPSPAVWLSDASGLAHYHQGCSNNLVAVRRRHMLAAPLSPSDS